MAEPSSGLSDNAIAIVYTFGQGDFQIESEIHARNDQLEEVLRIYFEELADIDSDALRVEDAWTSHTIPRTSHLRRRPKDG